MIVDNDQRVRLSQIPTLTFFEGEKTTHRRTSAVAQLSCQGAGCRVYKPDVVQCYNQGGTGTDIQWKCEADLPSSLKIGRVQVGCEGWEHSSDPYILKGSCGLEYTLKKVDANAFGGGGSKSESSWNIAANGFTLIFLLVTIFILYPLLRSILVTFFPFLNRYLPGGPTSGSSGPRGGGGGGGGRRGFGGGSWGGGGGGPPDPPPPYTPSSAPKPDPNAQSTGWRPGFWTGAAAGAAANSLFGRRREPYGYGAGYGPGYDFDRSPFAGRPGFGGGGFGGGGWGGGRDPRQGSSRDHDSGGLGQIRTSTGYGGTRNR